MQQQVNHQGIVNLEHQEQFKVDLNDGSCDMCTEDRFLLLDSSSVYEFHVDTR